MLGGDAARQLTGLGPHRVQRGNLAIVGMPGVVYTPAEGIGLPAVAFAHGWMTGTDRYLGLFEHLASWGIVVVAPNSERGLVPSHLDLAGDLRTALDVSTGLRLGSGKISVHADRLGLIGHGMGGGAAVIAAARRPVAALAALFPAPTAPAAEQLAPSITAPALVVAGAADIDSTHSNARRLAAALGGNVQLRVVDNASQTGLVEGRRLIGALGVGGWEAKTSKTTRALLTGYLLHSLTGDKKYRGFADDDTDIPRTTSVDPHAEPEPPKPPTRLEMARGLLGR